MSVTRSSFDILTEPPPPDADLRLTYGPERSSLETYVCLGGGQEVLTHWS
jgi:hypothetical protein